MKFFKDKSIPIINYGAISLLKDVQYRITRLSDGFVAWRLNKPRKNSFIWDSHKYEVYDVIFNKIIKN